VITIALTREVNKSELKQQDCSVNRGNISKEKALSLFEQGDVGVIYCYCIQDMKNRLNEDFKMLKGPSKKLCTDIYNEELKKTGLSFLIAIILTVSSYVVDATLAALSKFEKYTDLNKEYASRILKGFLMKYANSGLLILVINLRVKILTNDPFGRYDDLTPNWYITVGYSVIFAYVLKFVSLIFATFLKAFLPWMFRCCDRGCSSNMKNTKKKTLGEYVNLYLGPLFDIDNSYTEILKTVFVMATFGPMIPFIYPVSLLHIGLLFLRDKILSKCFIFYFLDFFL
jgi:hypothetical protein